jgi:hypothetical protein
MNQCIKGKVGEREAARVLREALDALGFSPESTEGIVRGQQHAGSPDSPDVKGIDGLFLEIKRTENTSWRQWAKKAVIDAGSNAPLIMHRFNRKDWWIAFRVQDIPRIVTSILKLKS